MIDNNSENDTFFSYIKSNQLIPQLSDHLYENDFAITRPSFDLSNNNFHFGLENIQNGHLSFEELSPNDLKEIEKKLYYIDNTEKKREKNYKFDIEETIKKKRGRHTNKNECERIHDRNSVDNIMRKIQAHYLSFIISFLNNILEILNYEQKFLKLDYKFKRNVNKNFVESLKRKTLAEIVCNKISVKYKNKDVNSNKLIYDEIKENEILKNILSENYVSFFKKIYYKSNKHINLEEYGLNKNIILSNNVKMFKDLLKNNEILNSNNEFKKRINDCLVQNFLPNSIFLFH